VSSEPTAGGLVTVAAGGPVGLRPDLAQDHWADAPDPGFGVEEADDYAVVAAGSVEHVDDRSAGQRPAEVPLTA
jgi:hypothetical protein